MDIRIKEPLYLISEGTEYIVRQGTVGVERNKVVFFYDNTRTNAVGFSRDFCIENPQMFQIAKTLADKEVSLRDVLKVLDSCALPKHELDELCFKLKSI